MTSLSRPLACLAGSPLSTLTTQWQSALAHADQAIADLICVYANLQAAAGQPGLQPLDLLLTQAALAFHVKRDLIVTRRRWGNLPLARWAIMQALQDDHAMTQNEIAQLLHCDHGTVSNGLKQIRSQTKYNPRIRALVNAFSRLRSRVDEAAPPNGAATVRERSDSPTANPVPFAPVEISTPYPQLPASQCSSPSISSCISAPPLSPSTPPVPPLVSTPIPSLP